MIKMSFLVLAFAPNGLKNQVPILHKVLERWVAKLDEEARTLPSLLI